jgi:hypothetical protein
MRRAACLAVAWVAGSASAQGEAGVLGVPIDLAAALMQDVERRDSYTAPVESNFSIPGGDGVSSMRFYGYSQFRYVANRRDTEVEDNDFTHGFGFREVRLGVRGALSVPELTYNVQMAFDTGQVRLTDAWLRYDLAEHVGEGWAVRFGSFKSPFLAEELMSATKQMLAERSVVDTYFQQGRAQQIELQYRNDHVSALLSFNDGWRNHVDNRLGDMWGVTARGEWRVMGDWKQHDDMQSWRGQTEPMLVLGVAGHVQDGNPSNITASEAGNRFLNDTRIAAWTFDAHFEVDGFSIFGAVVGEHDRPPGGGSRDAIGVMLQAGYFLTDNVQIAARGEWATTDGDIGRPSGLESGQDEFAAITAGVTYFFWGNNCKLTADVVVPLDEVGDVWTYTARGTLTDDAGESGQAAFRLMWQWVF